MLEHRSWTSIKLESVHQIGQEPVETLNSSLPEPDCVFLHEVLLYQLGIFFHGHNTSVYVIHRNQLFKFWSWLEIISIFQLCSWLRVISIFIVLLATMLGYVVFMAHTILSSNSCQNISTGAAATIQHFLCLITCTDKWLLNITVHV